MESEFGMMHFEDGKKGYKPRNARIWKRQGNDSALKPTKRMQP